jgi:hypothetical protein
VIVKDKLCVFVGPSVTEPLIVIGAVPAVASAVVLTVSVTATGLLDVGFTELEGRKLQIAPEGKFPQERFTVSLNDPCPVTWNDTGPEVPDGPTVMLAGEGAVKLKSTTFNVKAASFVTRCGSVPAP